ncbi:MAG: cadherin-like domain-containing protein, partial [Acidimicrobiales bacterium]|nr:cadherin-like domain-containing protein [Acidimicrobiales bacterium]
MDPNLTVGTRKQFTVLDWAALDDVGWEVAETFTPTIDSISNTAVDEDSSEVQINLAGISAGGAEIQPLSVSVSSDNTVLTGPPAVTYTSNETTGTLKFTPQSNQSGAATITVTVTDGGLDGNLATPGDNATFASSFDVTVNPVNDKPTVNAIADIELVQNASQQVVQLAGISAGGGETQDLLITATSSNSALMANPVVNYTSDNATGTITFQPIANTDGQTTITVNVVDAGLDGDLATSGDNATTVVTFDVTVNPVNNAPTIDVIADVGLLEDAATQIVNLTGITAGASESQPLAVSVTSDNPTLIPAPDVTYTSANDTGSLSFTPLTDQFGAATITVTVTDGGLDGNLATPADNGTVATAFDVIVSPVNDSPTINVLADLELDENAAQQVVQLAGISAGGGESQELLITATSSNAALMANPVVNYTSDNPTGAISFTPIATQSGSTTITVTVTDAGLDGNIVTGGDNSTTSVTFNVTVNPINDPPTIDAIADLGLLEDASTQVINLAGITAGSSESQPLEVAATSNNPTLIPNPDVTYTSANDTGSLSFTPLADQFGSATVTVTVTDGGLDGNLATPVDNGTFATTYDVVVSPVNDNPTINALADLELVENATQQLVQITGISAG